MTLRCSTLTFFWAACLWVGRALLVLGALGLLSSRHTEAQSAAQAGHGTPIPTGKDGEVILVPPSEVPSFGPAFAPLTLDLFLPFGHRATGPELRRYMQLVAEQEDIRLRLHPVLGSEVAERGAELSLAAWQLVGSDSAGFLIAVAENPDWLADWPAFSGWTSSDVSAQLGGDRRRDGDLHLFAAAAAHGIDVGQLQLSLRKRRQKGLALQLWGRVRAAVRSPPEIWLNGRRLRSPASESALREEIERQRRRAYHLLRAGTPLSGLYEELVATADSGEATAGPSTSGSWLGARISGGRTVVSSTTSPLPFRPRRMLSQPTRMDLTEVPLRGPLVSPVTVVLVGNLESGPTCELARELRDVLRPYADAVRFAYLPAPNGPLLSTAVLGLPGTSPLIGERAHRVPLILAALAQENSLAFFRSYDAIIDLMRRRFLLSYVEFAQSILNQRVDFDRLEVQSRQAPARALLLRAQREAQRLGASSLPALFVNGRLVPNVGSGSGLSASLGGPRSEQLTRLIEAELHRGLLEKLRSRPRP